VNDQVRGKRGPAALLDGVDPAQVRYLRFSGGDWEPVANFRLEGDNGQVVVWEPADVQPPSTRRALAVELIGLGLTHAS
jgi:hypothetical protein